MASIKSRFISDANDYFERVIGQIENNLNSSEGFLRDLIEWTEKVEEILDMKSQAEDFITGAFGFLNSVKTDKTLATGQDLRTRLKNLAPNVQTEITTFLKNITFNQVEPYNIESVFKLCLPKFKCNFAQYSSSDNPSQSQLRFEVQDSVMIHNIKTPFHWDKSRIDRDFGTSNRSKVMYASPIKSEKSDRRNMHTTPIKYRSRLAEVNQNVVNESSPCFLSAQKRGKHVTNPFLSIQKIRESFVFDCSSQRARSTERTTHPIHRPAAMPRESMDSKFWKNDENLLAEAGFLSILNRGHQRGPRVEINKKKGSEKAQIGVSSYLRKVTPEVLSGFKPHMRLTSQDPHNTASDSRLPPKVPRSTLANKPVSKERKTLQNFIENSKVKEFRIESSKTPNKVVEVEVRRSVSKTAEDTRNHVNLKRLMVGKFANQIKDLKNNKLVTLDLPNGDIGDDQINALMTLLEKATSLKYIKLNSNRITDKSIKTLTSFLINSNVETIDLSGNKLSMIGYKYLYVISQSKNSVIRSINLRNNLFEPKNYSHMADKFKEIGVLLEI